MNGLTVNGLTVNGLTLEAPSVVGNGGGLNSSWSTVDLTNTSLALTDGTTAPAGGLPSGKAANVEFLFVLNTSGTYRIVVDAELLP